jgi:hypothetical protein
MSEAPSHHVHAPEPSVADHHHSHAPDELGLKEANRQYFDAQAHGRSHGNVIVLVITTHFTNRWRRSQVMKLTRLLSYWQKNAAR